MPNETEAKPTILHVCTRETLRPIRDEVLRVNGFVVSSTMAHGEALSMFRANKYDVVLVDVEGESGVEAAEKLCSEVKRENKEQLVGFVCNWRVAVQSNCPDEIVRTEFSPEAFVEGVRAILSPNLNQ